MRDYRVYQMNRKEKLLYLLKLTGIGLILAKVFFDSFWMAGIGVVLLPFLFRRKEKELAKSRREELALEFKEFILALSASLRSGYSAENAVALAQKDLAFIYTEKSYMINECMHMRRQLSNNKPLEHLITEFAERSGQEDIRDFAAVFALAKRSGGNMGGIIRNTAEIIGEKIDAKREIQLLYAGRRMEQNIMNLVPVGIIVYVRMTTPDYFDCMYRTPLGMLVMSLCLAVYATAYMLSVKIMDIEV